VKQREDHKIIIYWTDGYSSYHVEDCPIKVIEKMEKNPNVKENFSMLNIKSWKPLKIKG
jgi:hypothetical protein